MSPRFAFNNPYDVLLSEVYYHGEVRTDRTGVGTRSIFAPNPLRFNLHNRGLALITSKQVAWRMATREFMWMLSGSTNTKDLQKTSAAMAMIWNNWSDENGDIGPTYGAQYRNSGHSHYAKGVDQLARVIETLTDKPDSRRALISLWGARELDAMGIEPCMVLFQFSLRGKDLDQLELHVYQRSADMMLGVPFDLFQASLLAHLVARELTMTSKRRITATDLIWSAGDVHIYENHLDAAHLQLNQALQAPLMSAKLDLPMSDSFRLLDNTLTAAHITVDAYHTAPAIAAGPIAV